MMHAWCGPPIDLLDHMTEAEASIKFTVEVELESRLPFLYVCALTLWCRRCNLHKRLQKTNTYRSLPQFQLPPPPGTQVSHCQNITPPSAMCDLVSGRPETGESSPTEGPSEEWLPCTGYPTSLRVTISLD